MQLQSQDVQSYIKEISWEFYFTSYCIIFYGQQRKEVIFLYKKIKSYFYAHINSTITPLAVHSYLQLKVN
jgi:hypothetical protein